MIERSGVRTENAVPSGLSVPSVPVVAGVTTPPVASAATVIAPLFFAHANYIAVTTGGRFR